MKESNILIGYEYDAWVNYNEKIKIEINCSTHVNSHLLISGMSGSGKSYLINQVLARFSKNTNTMIYFADFKQDDAFSHLSQCERYYPYTKTTEALEIVYEILHNRQSGIDKSRNSVTLIWDEYMANILFLQGIEKKKADSVMKKVSEILMLGRSLAVRLVISCQRLYAIAFPTGSRLNYGIIIIIGAAIKSIYEMLLPKEYIEKIAGRCFNVGEGVMLNQGSELHFLKIPMIMDNEELKALCIKGLS